MAIQTDSPPPQAPSSIKTSYRASGYYLPRLLGLIYAFAFFSWAYQWQGLVGDKGILPAHELIENIRAFEQRKKRSLWLQYPTIFRLGHLHEKIGLLSVMGGVLGLLVFIGLTPGPALFILWALYLSIVTAGDIFMNYQWDIFLLEAGFIGIFYASWKGGKGWRAFCARRDYDPPPAAVFLMHWLIFRIMFQSGAVKILGGDTSWIDLTALTYHYETQPLPHVGGWLAHQLPLWMDQLSCLMMHGIELILPVAVFCGAIARRWAAYGFIVLMAAVFFTGNYNFFNLLTATVALSLLDDQAWPVKRLKKFHAACFDRPVRSPWSLACWPSLIFAPVAILLTLIAADQSFSYRVQGYTRVFPQPFHELYQHFSGLRSFNAYGLFQSMTKMRDEVILEVSSDGTTWHELECKYKPGNPYRMPAFVAPHQPRLDWQMWFAALVPDGFQWPRDAHRSSPLYWFTKMTQGLLQHKLEIWALFGKPPIEIREVRFIRALRYRYRMSDLATLLYERRWWEREYVGIFMPAVSLRNSNTEAPQ
ncbi:MAG: lipase maturation factor family protein [Verrucomicrobiae bacterium]|nr:lipase maturation factor family protein [Verrucomicrobiae bacterium]